MSSISQNYSDEKALVDCVQSFFQTSCREDSLQK